MTWKEISEAQYTAALECLPPALWLAHGFLLGEPETHINGVPVFAPYLQARREILCRLATRDAAKPSNSLGYGLIMQP
jgi:hypothetical protein